MLSSKAIYNLIVLIVLFVVVNVITGCSKDDDSSDCAFIGKWCVEHPASGNCLVSSNFLEFRADGELLQFGTSFFTWESSDCETIDIVHNATGMKSAEYFVHEVNDSTMLIDIGIGPTELWRVD